MVKYRLFSEMYPWSQTLTYVYIYIRQAGGPWLSLCRPGNPLLQFEGGLGETRQVGNLKQLKQYGTYWNFWNPLEPTETFENFWNLLKENLERLKTICNFSDRLEEELSKEEEVQSVLDRLFETKKGRLSINHQMEMINQVNTY